VPERQEGVDLQRKAPPEGVVLDISDDAARVAEGVDAELPAVVSFAAVFRSEYRGLVAIAWGLTGSRETAEDLAQEALLTLHRRLERGDVIDSPAAYVRKTCSNLAVSWIRRRMVETRALLRMGAPQGSAPALDARDELFWSEVRRLPRRQAQVVALFYGYDMSVADVAATLEMSTGSAKTHLHRGRLTLASRLGLEAPLHEEGR
jgi:RNA polymerase sigma factor (sigma-70 family)